MRVSGLPQLRDATASVAEDNLLTINPYAQADTPLAGGNGGFASNIVNGPAHGSITVNADGTYNYTPDANYNGADSFSYNLSDPAATGLNSNTATVTLNVTSVNDAPTGTSNTVTTLENKPYVFQAIDFGFSDAQDAVAPAQAGAQSNQTLDSGLRRNDGSNNFAAVIIGALPSAGTLTNNGVAVR